MLLLGKQANCQDYIIAIVAALSTGDPLLHYHPQENIRDDFDGKFENDFQKEDYLKIKKIHEIWENPTSDLLTWMNAIGAYEYAGATEEFCKKHYLHIKTMKEIHLLRIQLTKIVNAIDPTRQKKFNFLLDPPTREQKIVLRQIITSGFIDQVGRRVEDTNSSGSTTNMADRFRQTISRILRTTGNTSSPLRLKRR